MSVEFTTVPPIGYDDFLTRLDRSTLDVQDRPLYPDKLLLVRPDDTTGVFIRKDENGNVEFEAFGEVSRKVALVFPIVARQFSVSFVDQYGLPVIMDSN